MQVKGKPKLLSFSKIKNRKELNELFDSVFLKTHRDIKQRQKFSYEDTLPKSYIVEFNTGDKKISQASEEIKREALFKTLEEIKLDIDIEIYKTDDPSLTYIKTKKLEFFLDSLDSRFLFFHTLAKSNDSNNFIFQRLIKNGHHFDSAWLTVQFLEKLAISGGDIEGWDARFNPIPDVEAIEQPSYMKQRVSVSIDEPNSWGKYERNKIVNFFEELPLDTLRVRHITEDGLVARARVQSDGKLTGRGTSFQEYMNIAIDVKNSYKKTITELEDKYSIRFFQKEGGIGMRGEPFVITFSKKIERFEDLIKAMFSCALPFRLFGTPQKIKEDYYIVNAVDLHIASKVYFEITPTFMRIYLPDNTCGNTIARIVRSLQHMVDSNLTSE